MKDVSSSPRSEAPTFGRRAVLAGLAALGVTYAMPGLFQVNEAMAEPMRRPGPHGPGHSKHSRRSRKSRRSKKSRHSKASRHSRDSRSRHSKAHRRDSRRSRRSHASRARRLHDALRRPI